VSRGKIIAAVVTLVVVGAVVAGVALSAQSGAPVVTVAKATTETLGVIVTASGKVEAAAKSDVYPPGPGTLQTIETTDGATVKAGEVIAIMDTAPFELQVQQAYAGVKGAYAQLEAVNNGVPAAIDKSGASAGVNAANSSYSAAHQAYSGFLAAYNAAPAPVKPSMEATLTQFKIANDQAYAALLKAKAGQSQLSKAAKIAAAKASANASINSANYALRVAKSSLSKATLTAPMDGIVIFNALGVPGADGSVAKAAPGAAVAPQAAPFTVVRLGEINFNAQVDEADVDKIKSGMKAKISLDAFSSDTFDGTVEAIRSTAIQTTTGGIAFPVLVKIDPKAKDLLLGMSGSVDIQVSAVPDALTVPIEAILDESGKKFVFVVEATKVRKVEVTTGSLTDTRAQIIKGLKEGDTVATDKLSELKDGASVRVQ